VKDTPALDRQAGAAPAMDMTAGAAAAMDMRAGAAATAVDSRGAALAGGSRIVEALEQHLFLCGAHIVCRYNRFKRFEARKKRAF
jgi:hypothetical protein